MSPPLAASPFQNSIGPQVCHVPPRFIAIHSVYCSGPLHPGGVTSGHRPGPDFLVNSTATPSLRIDSDVIVAVAGHAAAFGDEWITAAERLNASTPPPPPPP